MQRDGIDGLDVAGRMNPPTTPVTTTIAIITASMPTMTSSQCFSVRATAAAGTIPSGNGCSRRF